MDKKLFGWSLTEYQAHFLRHALLILLLVGGSDAAQQLLVMGRLDIDSEIIVELRSFLRLAKNAGTIGIALWLALVVKRSTAVEMPAELFGRGAVGSVLVGLASAFAVAAVAFVFRVMKGELVTSVFYLISFVWRCPGHIMAVLVVVEVMLAVIYFRGSGEGSAGSGSGETEAANHQEGE